MSQITLDLPEGLLERLERMALRRGTSIERLAADCLSRLPEVDASDLAGDYDRFIRESGLFREPARAGQAVPEERLRYLAAKLG